MTKYDFYIASGFFNEEQIEEVEYIKQELSKRGYSYFSPKDESQIPDLSNYENRRKIFLANEEAIRKSDKVIVNTNNKDMGTIWEAGYATALNKPVIYLHLSKTDKFNLMLSESATCSCATKEQFEDALNFQYRYWEEEVE